MESGREARNHPVADGRLDRRGAAADARRRGANGADDLLLVAGAGGRRQRLFADAHPQGRSCAGRLQVGLPLQRRRFVDRLRRAGGCLSCRSGFLRAADSGAYRAGALSSGAGQCAGYDPEYDLHAAVPLRAAVEDHFRRVACERCAGRDDGAGRMRRVEPGRAAPLVDRGAGGAAVVFQRLAAAPHGTGFDAPAA